MSITNIFSALPAKLYQWFMFTKTCFWEHGDSVYQARKIQKTAIKAFEIQSKLEIERTDELQSSIAIINGIYFGTISQHDSIQTLALSGHALNSMTLLRPQLEALLLLIYIFEDNKSDTQIIDRTMEYIDWVIVKKKQNFDTSIKSSLTKIFYKEEDLVEINDEYEYVKDKYLNNIKEFKKLVNSNNFLDYNERLRLVKQTGIEDLYYHIYPHSSSTVHFGDIGDRMHPILINGNEGYFFEIRKKNASLWPISVSNMIEISCISQYAKFFNIKDDVNHFFDNLMSN